MALELGVNLLRSDRCKNGSRSQCLTERVRDTKRLTSYSKALPRMDEWEADVKDADWEVTYITIANCLRRLFHRCAGGSPAGVPHRAVQRHHAVHRPGGFAHVP